MLFIWLKRPGDSASIGVKYASFGCDLMVYRTVIKYQFTQGEFGALLGLMDSCTYLSVGPDLGVVDSFPGGGYNFSQTNIKSLYGGTVSMRSCVSSLDLEMFEEAFREDDLEEKVQNIMDKLKNGGFIPSEKFCISANASVLGVSVKGMMQK